MLSPAAIYKLQQKTPSFDTDNSHQLIKATLEYLAKSLSLMVQKPDQAEIFQIHSARALTSIYVLQSSLDFERGGDIANSLFQLYEYSRQQVLKVMRQDNSGDLEQASHAISEILDAWHQIK
ncbi:MAG TPA: flagellar biosynthesis protein FliS [Rhodobacteraceae bacterium]|jgi:flagellar protein FliS|nr:putative flagellar protein FliS [Rhodobacteraceae bacterium HTCC2083]HCW84127.1 flagellar biosynthesis protein FliS [Paracoccaceae bacterium]